MRSRKAFAESQIHWMFVLIAGAIILTFFVSLVLKQKDVSESKIAKRIVDDLETVTTGASVSKGTAQVIDKPNFDLEYGCSGDVCRCEYSMKGNSQRLGDKIVYAPSRLTGRELIAWTMDWNAPFRITNFLFLTTPKTRYYLIYDESSSHKLFDHVNKSLPSRIVKVPVGITDSDRSNLTSKEDYNYPQVKLVYLNIEPETNDGVIFNNWNIDASDVGIVHIKAYVDDNSFDSGNITFYEYDESSGKFQKDEGLYGGGGVIDFAGEESIYAAIFAHDYDIYACNMKKAFDYMSLIVNIYRLRVDEIKGDAGCAANYDAVGSSLDDLITRSKTLSDDILSDFDDYRDIRKALDENNRKLQIQSCPSVY